jgi:hypothetical protein
VSVSLTRRIPFCLVHEISQPPHRFPDDAFAPTKIMITKKHQHILQNKPFADHWDQKATMLTRETSTPYCAIQRNTILFLFHLIAHLDPLEIDSSLAI